jgi:hypothetical protein
VLLGSVPTLVITSDGDKTLLSDADLQDLLDLHAVSADDALVHFGGVQQCTEKDGSVEDSQDARAPMITHADKFNRAVYDWIESVA